MPTFFFNQDCPRRETTDLVGRELPNSAAAVLHAQTMARAILKSQLRTAERPNGSVRIEDEQHRPLVTVLIRFAGD